MAATKDQFFKPSRQSGTSKAAATESAARLIIEAEAVQRDKKTERLRLLRQARDEAIVPEPQARPKARKPAKG